MSVYPTDCLGFLVVESFAVLTQPLTQPSSKLDHTWLGPFPICQQISKFAYKLTLLFSMEGVHPLFHVLVQRKHKPDLIMEHQQPEPKNVKVIGNNKWELKTSLIAKYNTTTSELLTAGRDLAPNTTHGSQGATWNIILSR